MATLFLKSNNEENNFMNKMGYNKFGYIVYLSSTSITQWVSQESEQSLSVLPSSNSSPIPLPFQNNLKFRLDVIPNSMIVEKFHLDIEKLMEEGKYQVFIERFFDSDDLKLLQKNQWLRERRHVFPAKFTDVAWSSASELQCEGVGTFLSVEQNHNMSEVCQKLEVNSEDFDSTFNNLIAFYFVFRYKFESGGFSYDSVIVDQVVWSLRNVHSRLEVVSFNFSSFERAFQFYRSHQDILILTQSRLMSYLETFESDIYD